MKYISPKLLNNGRTKLGCGAGSAAGGNLDAVTVCCSLTGAAATAGCTNGNNIPPVGCGAGSGDANTWYLNCTAVGTAANASASSCSTGTGPQS